MSNDRPRLEDQTMTCTGWINPEMTRLKKERAEEAMAQLNEAYLKSKNPDPVNHPAHYNSGKIEVIEFIEDKGLGFHLGNVVKYVARAGIKDPGKLIEDLKKARWYLDRAIEVSLSEEEGRAPVRPNDMTKKAGA